MTSRTVKALALLVAATLAAGCSSGKGNAKKQDLAEGYQPSPDSSSNRVELERLSGNLFRVTAKGAPPEDFRPQANAVWCWAAAAAAVLAREGVDVGGRPADQDELVSLFALNRSDQSAGPDLIVRALAPELSEGQIAAREKAAEKRSSRKPPKGKVWVDGQPELPGVIDLVKDLLSGEMGVIAIEPVDGDFGHVYLVYGLEFGTAVKETFGNQAPYFVSKAFVVDPMNGERLVLTAGDHLSRIGFASGRSGAVRYLRASTEGYRKARWVSASSPDNPNRIEIRPFQ